MWMTKQRVSLSILFLSTAPIRHLESHVELREWKNVILIHQNPWTLSMGETVAVGMHNIVCLLHDLREGTYPIETMPLTRHVSKDPGPHKHITFMDSENCNHLPLSLLPLTCMTWHHNTLYILERAYMQEIQKQLSPFHGGGFQLVTINKILFKHKHEWTGHGTWCSVALIVRSWLSPPLPHSPTPILHCHLSLQLVFGKEGVCLLTYIVCTNYLSTNSCDTGTGCNIHDMCVNLLNYTDDMVLPVSMVDALHNPTSVCVGCMLPSIHHTILSTTLQRPRAW